MTQYYITPDGKIRAVESGQEFLNQPDWVKLTEQELAEALAPPPPTWDNVRDERDARIREWQPFIDRHRNEVDAGLTPTWTTEQYQSVLAYLAALADVPQQDCEPKDVVWPTEPSVDRYPNRVA